MVRFQTAYRNESLNVLLISAAYSAGYAEQDFNLFPSVSFPLQACFYYKSGWEQMLVSAHHVLLEKAQTSFTVLKSGVFESDLTLSFQFLKPAEDFEAFFKFDKPAALFRRSVRTEVLLRRFASLALGEDELLKEQLIFEIANSICFADAPQAQRENLHIIKQIDRSKDFIHAHFADDLTIADLAAVANFSPFHFVRAFKKISSYTPYDYLLRTRIEQAKILLRTGLPASRVSFETGFNSLENFSFAFRRLTGSSPSEFKKRNISKVP
ncbi:MAG TPA: AraC family transcriptional regulator [Saprospiraceae bacterium]|nr:AraC family transcriptional regulator [Saprospiraceae bacterium]